MDYESTRETIKWLLTVAWLLPLAGFTIEVFGGWWSGRKSRAAAYMAVGCIATGFVCSVAAYLTWSEGTDWPTRYALEKAEAHAGHDFDHADINHDAVLSQEEFGHTHVVHELLESLESEAHSDHAEDGEHHGEEHAEHDHADLVHSLLHEADHDHTHTIDLHEFQAFAVAVARTQLALENADADGDGSLGSDEVEAWRNLHGLDFHAADADENGTLNPDELRAELAMGGHHGHGDEEAGEESGHHEVKAYAGSLYTLGSFGNLTVSLDYYVDSLTLLMFMMVTLIATCIHVFAIGYMSDELTDDYVDHHAHTSDGKHVHRPGRFYRFFSFLSLFCFSMLGLVFAGNVFQVFVFWELVGICSYLLIGFYTERKSASNAANKAFIMNRVGDFGFLIGLMVVWTWFGSFQFVETNEHGVVTGGLFATLRGADGGLEQVEMEDGSAGVVLSEGENQTVMPYSLLVVAGLGIFAGCIGKSAQFPLQTWLPDAMEGPTPVSALVHSATMVAAGVYLVGRFYPMFTPEVLLTIAYTGCITLFVAATIAVVATDIKKVLAYSTISQLGYMMLGLGVFGWAAGLFHLITHAFFKSLMFLASGSVICGCHHEQEMPKMGGLLKKMPITALTMLVGVVAISGLAIPGSVQLFGEALALSGYHSKDAIVATALTFSEYNGTHFLLFFAPLVTAGITAFYMFRLWFYTFLGKPRDQHIYDHVHESPWVMTAPLLVLSVFAAFCAVGGEQGRLFLTLMDSEPANVSAIHEPVAAGVSGLSLFGHHDVHNNHATAGLWALIAAISGTLVAFVIYGAGLVNPDEIRRQFKSLYAFLVDKWRFDEMYDTMFVRPAHVVASWCAWFDRTVFDGILHGAARVCVSVSKWDRRFDEAVVDGLVNLVGDATLSVGRSFKTIQTGKIRQYVMFIALGVMALFVVVFLCFPK